MRRAFRFITSITLLLLWHGAALGYTTLSGVSISRSFSPASAQPGQQVTVTLTVKTGTLSSPLRGFYLSEAVPDALSPSSVAATLDGKAITVKTESLGSGTIYTGNKTVRWVLEEPPSWTENNPVPANATVVLTYGVTVPSGTTGSLSFPGAMWIAMIPSLGDGGDNFGYEDNASTLPVAQQPALTLSPTSLSFSVQEGAGAPTDQSVAVQNGGGGTLPTVATDVTYGTGGSDWLTVTKSGSDNSQSLSNKADPAGLKPNTYSATVKVSATGVGNSPQSYTVSFTVTAKPSTTDPTIALSPTSLSFSAEEGGSPPASKTVTVTNVGVGTMAKVTHTVSYVNGADWLSVTEGGADNDQSLETTVDPAGLGPDTYTATVSVDSPGASNTPQNYTVSLTVTPGSGPPPDGGPGGDGSADGGPGLTDDEGLEGGCSLVAGQPTTSTPLLLTLALLGLLVRRRTRS